MYFLEIVWILNFFWYCESLVNDKK